MREPIDVAIDKFINLHRAVSSMRTVEYYEDSLMRFKEYCNIQGYIYIDEFNQDKFISYVASLRNTGLKNVSINTYTRALRVFAHWCVNQDYISKSFCDGIKNLSNDAEQIFPLTSKQVNEVDEYFGFLPFDTPSCNNMNYLELRNYILFHLMLDCGLRRQEVINLDVKDLQASCLVIRNSKFNKSRIVPLPQELHDYINQYIRLENRKKGPLLLTNKGIRITISSIKKVFANLSDELSMSVHPHLLRHTFATSYIAGGGNLEFLRIMLGHSTYNVTQRYLHIAAQCNISNINIYKLDKCFFRNYNSEVY